MFYKVFLGFIGALGIGTASFFVPRKMCKGNKKDIVKSPTHPLASGLGTPKIFLTAFINPLYF
ncbi:hypothetical protein A5893_04585 [Pedobacter psychrophilus]|uniref:Uncharacterized protein n=1 Tax=Pedobacter psychrophilus TaxID=1826909 RepID=A0A179DGM5_9SPHI|nr:hypothetical protein A5893_04585 [Pedobacter psychrophilus]